MISEVYNRDCMVNMGCYPDGFFDLAIVDPPYGIDASNMKLGEGGGLYRAPKTYKRGNWDKEPPDPEYFRQLFRVAKDVIIFGANHFISRLPPDRQDASCWVVWDKNNGETSFADVELAWTSFDRHRGWSSTHGPALSRAGWVTKRRTKFTRHKNPFIYTGGS